jgi:hypothetical protein
MRRCLLVMTVLAVVATAVLVAGPAAAHTGQAVTADCATVRATFADFGLGDHPISFEVSVRGGPFVSVAAIETPPNFVGTGTATADISSLTSVLQGAPGEVAVFASWPGGQTATVTFTLTCGESPPPTTTTSPPPPTTTSPPTTAETPPPRTAPPPVERVVFEAPVPAVPVAAPPATAG